MKYSYFLLAACLLGNIARSAEPARMLRSETGDRFARVTFAPSGTLIAAVGHREQKNVSDHGILSIWDAVSGKQLFRTEAFAILCGSVDFSPRDNLIAVGCADWSINILRYGTNAERQLLVSPVKRIPQAPGKFDRSRLSDLVRFSPNGKLLAFTGPTFLPGRGFNPLSMVRYCEVGNYDTLHVVQGNWALSGGITFAAPELLLVWGKLHGATDLQLYSVDDKTGQAQSTSIDCHEEVRRGRHFSASANGKFLVNLCGGQIVVLDASLGEIHRISNDRKIRDLAVSPDGKFIASSDYENRLELRAAATGEAIAEWSTGLSSRRRLFFT